MAQYFKKKKLQKNYAKLPTMYEMIKKNHSNSYFKILRSDLDKSYLGPVHPIVVPKPPLSFSTASLLSSFFIASISAHSSKQSEHKSNHKKQRSNTLRSQTTQYHQEAVQGFHKAQPPHQWASWSCSTRSAALLHFKPKIKTVNMSKIHQIH